MRSYVGVKQKRAKKCPTVRVSRKKTKSGGPVWGVQGLVGKQKGPKPYNP